MNIPKSALYSALAVTMGASVPALASSATASVDPHAKVVTLQFQSGGNTPASRKRMAEEAKVNNYDLQIHLPNTGDDYRDMTVTVTDSNNLPVLSAHAGGPLFYARLPKGEYSVKVDTGNKEARAEDIMVSPQHAAAVSPTLHG